MATDEEVEARVARALRRYIETTDDVEPESLADIACTEMRAIEREKAQRLTDMLEAKGVTINPDVRVTVGPDGSSAGWIDGKKIVFDSPSGT